MKEFTNEAKNEAIKILREGFGFDNVQAEANCRPIAKAIQRYKNNIRRLQKYIDDLETRVIYAPEEERL